MMASTAAHYAQAAGTRDIPIVYEADVAVAGGSGAAVAAACAAADQGAKVVLVAPRPYLGDDICGRQHLWLETDEKPESVLAKSIFPDGRITTPASVKSALDTALLRRGVEFLTWSHASELLVDEKGSPAGLVMVNRSGSQAVKAKVIVDASSHAVIARRAGARFRQFVPGEKEFRFVVVGGELQAGPRLSGRKLGVTFRNPGSSNTYPVYEYSARLSLADDSYPSLARAEQEVRNMVSGAEMKDCSEHVYYLPEDTLIGEKRLDGGDKYDIGAFRPRGIPQIYVLSEYADLAGQAQSAMTKPLGSMSAGELAGKAAAEESKKVSCPGEIRLADAEGTEAVLGENLEFAAPAGPSGTVKVLKRLFPVIGQYDVVVVGGGTSGAPAGIAAARSGARTLVVEYLDELGGVGTAGMIGVYWYGIRGGFTKEIDDSIGGKNAWNPPKKNGWNVVQKSEWLRRELLKAKADIWFSSFGCGAIVDNGRVTGVLVATPHGCGVVLAKTVVDSTGNADIAHCAGATTQFSISPHGMLSVQLAGYPRRNMLDNVNNTCFAMVDDTNVRDVWHLMASVRASDNKAYDFGQLLDSRERRRIVADYMLTTQDILNHRTFPDTISQHKSNFDAAAFPVSPMLLVKDMKGPAFEVDLPYRSLLPQGLDGIIVTGLGAGAERDAMTLVRMQPDLQNQGYAAGTAAAMAAAGAGHTRNIDIKKLQKQMVEKGALAEKVLADKDSYPMGKEVIEKAVVDVATMGREINQSRKIEDKSIFSLAVIMAHPEQSIPLLKAAYANSKESNTRINYAKILGILGDATGAKTLIDQVKGAGTWDKGYGLTTHRESDNSFSDLDRLVIALGFSGVPEGLDPIVEKAAHLRPDSELSHFNALSVALRHYKCPGKAVEPLVRLLNEPGFAGHAQVEAVDMKSGKVTKRHVASTKPVSDLNSAFKELLVAGMLVHCGDSGNTGRKILEQYSRDINGHFSRYAQYILATGR
jgi:flavin-dependent dehydrogenase